MFRSGRENTPVFEGGGAPDFPRLSQSRDPLPKIDPAIEALTKQLGLIILNSKAELDQLGTRTSLLRTLIDGLADIRYAPQIYEVILRYIYHEVIRASETETDDNPTGEKTLVVPGFTSPNEFLHVVISHLEGATKTSRVFRSPSPRRRVMDDAYELAYEIIDDGIPRQGLGYSRGGLVYANAFQYLESIGKADLITRLILVASPVNGISPNTARIAKRLGLDALKDLCADSEAVRFWQNLSAKSRAKIIVVSSIFGDVFTTAHGAHIDGATNIFDKSSTHQEKVMDPNNATFQMISHLVKQPVVSAN